MGSQKLACNTTIQQRLKIKMKKKLLCLCLTMIGLLPARGAKLLKSVNVHTIDVGQGDAHIIECQNTDNEREYAIVDIGTTSGKRDDVIRKIDGLVMKGKLSHVFLTHPDKDHISYLYDLYTFPSFQGKVTDNGNGLSGNTKIHVGGSAGDWGLTKMRKEVKYLFASKMNYYTRDKFPNGKTYNIPFCWNQMNMEILYAYGEKRRGSTVNNNEKSLVMRLSGAPTTRTMLFMGDFEGKAPLQALLGHGVNAKLRSDVWVLP